MRDKRERKKIGARLDDSCSQLTKHQRTIFALSPSRYASLLASFGHARVPGNESQLVMRSVSVDVEWGGKILFKEYMRDSDIERRR